MPYYIRRQKQLSQQVPKGYYTAKTTGDGNCLYSAVSLSLFGEESHSPLIRLAAVCHAVEHFHHYSDMVIIAVFHLYNRAIELELLLQYEKSLPDIGDAHQFLSSVMLSDLTFNARPVNNPTVCDLITYMLQKEIVATAHLGTFSGQSYPVNCCMYVL